MISPSSFTGRHREIELLRTNLADAVAGNERLVLIGGEPGIGKSRLASELAHDCTARGIRVLWGRCWEGAGAPAFWPWLQIVRSYIRDRGLDLLRSALGPAAPEVSELLPEIGSGSDPARPRLLLEPDQARFRMFDGFSRFFGDAAALEPLVVILDDLHCADEATLLLLQFLVGHAETRRLLLVATYRDGELDSQPVLAHTLAELARTPRSLRMRLRGFTESEVADFIERSAGQRPSGSLAATMHERTDGNPLFLTEVVRLFTEEGRLDGLTPETWRVAIPRALREVIEHRLTLLSEPSRSLLASAAVIGREFELQLLRIVSDLPEECLFTAMDVARLSQIVQEISETPGRYRFTHVLLRDILYAELPLRERIRLHHRIGNALETLSGEGRAIHVASLAHHFLQSAVGGGGEKAALYSRQAGDHAMASLAYEEAVPHYQRALDAMALLAMPPERVCEVLVALGDALRSSGQTERARVIYERAVEKARTLDAPALLARAALGLGEPWTVGVNQQHLVGLLREALRRIGNHESWLQVRLRTRLSLALPLSSQSEEAIRLGQEAVDIARRGGDPEAQMYALIGQLAALWVPHYSEERLRLARELACEGEKLGRNEMVASSRFFLVPIHLERGDLASADRALELGTVLAADIRLPRYLWQPSALRAMRYALEGRFAEAEHLAQATWSKWRGTVPLADVYFWAQTIVLRRDQGTLADIAGAITQLADEHGYAPVWRCALAHVLAESGQLSEARLVFDRLAVEEFRGVPEDLYWMIGIALLAELSVQLEDRPRAQVLYGLLSPFFDRVVVAGGGAICEGAVARYLGMLATTLSRWQDAEEHFQQALAVDSKLHAPPLVARSQLAYAQMLLQKGAANDRQKAESLLSTALETAQRIGMHGLVAKIQAPQSAMDLAREVSARTKPGGEHRTARQHESAAGGILGSGGARADVNTFKCEGDYWRVAYEGSALRLKDGRGIRYITELLRHPDRDIHVLDLVNGLHGTIAHGDLAPHDARGERVQQGSVGDVGLGLDARARAAYKRRLLELDEELREAERLNDLGRIALSRDEFELITAQLLAESGLGNRGRTHPSPVERARVSVRNSITLALKRIARHDDALWRHLANALKTGTFCAYRPDRPIHWEL